MVLKLILKSKDTNSEIEVDETISTKDLREIIAKKFETTAECIVIIFNGKVIRDTNSFAEFKFQNGSTIHTMIKEPPQGKPASKSPITATKPTPVQPQTAQPAQTTAAPNLFDNMFSSMNASGSRDMLNNPELLAQFASNPTIQSLLSDPAVMDVLMKNNPQMKNLMETHPEFAAILKDPENLKHMIEIMKNPAMYQETLRSQDRILAQLENIPGGMSQITRLFNDIHRPPPSTTSQANPFTQLRSGSTTTNVTSDRSQANTTGTPLPNPWGSSPAASIPANNASDNQGNKSSLIKDFERNFSTLPQTDSTNKALSDAILAQIQSLIQNLSPRAQYGFVEFIKGLEVLREESPMLVSMIFNYQFLNFQAAAANLAATESAAPPPAEMTEESLVSQLNELQMMGFENKAENLQALRFAYGDVNGAVNWILSRRGNL